jgi:ligand-binding sensor domain-containing protein
MRAARLLWLLVFLGTTLTGLPACGLQSDAIVVIALHPKNPNILYIATNDYIYKSRDEGRSWEAISHGMSHSRVIAMAIDPAYPATVYAGTKGDAVYKSYDGGQRWVSQRAGLDDVTVTSVVNQLVFDQNDNTHLWAATTMGIFESMDGGETWTKRMAGMKEILMVVTLAIDPFRPDIMYAGTSGGVYKSVDRARTWAKANNGLIPPELLSSSRALMVNTLVIDPQRPDTVYVATLNGLYKTEDGARSWTRTGQDLPDQMISALALDPSWSGTLYVAGRQGVFKSIDGGRTWQGKNAGLASLNVRSLALSPEDPKTVYLGTNGSGLYRSRDGGETWETLPLTAAKRT